MKTSWIIGVITIYLIIMAAELMATNGTAFSASTSENLTTLMSPTMANYSSSTSAFASIVTNVGTYVMTFLQAMFLWSPTIFSGYWIWFWLFICLPVSIGMVLSVVQILRGVRAG